MMRSLAAFGPSSVSALLLVGTLAGCGLLPEQKDETAGWSASKLL